MSPASRSQLQLLGQGRNGFQISMAKSRSGFWQAGAAGRQNPRGECQGTGDEHLGVFRGGVFAWAEQMEMGSVCHCGLLPEPPPVPLWGTEPCRQVKSKAVLEREGWQLSAAMGCNPPLPKPTLEGFLPFSVS